MTKMTCNICNKEIDNKETKEYHHNCFKKTAHFDSIKEGSISKSRCFEFTIDVTNFQFNTSGFDVCQDCVLDAIKKVLE